MKRLQQKPPFIIGLAQCFLVCAVRDARWSDASRRNGGYLSAECSAQFVRQFSPTQSYFCLCDLCVLYLSVVQVLPANTHHRGHRDHRGGSCREEAQRVSESRRPPGEPTDL